MFERTNVTNINVTGLVVQPGDTVILATDKRVTRDQWEKITAAFKDVGATRVVIAEEMDLAVLREPPDIAKSPAPICSGFGDD